MKHTDTPWYGMVDGKFHQSDWYGQNDDAGSYTSAPIVASDGTTVALVVMEGFHDEELKANAEFIVKAVNSHYPLIEALELAEKTIDILWVSHHANRSDHALEVVREALSMVKSTINSVRGEVNG